MTSRDLWNIHTPRNSCSYTLLSATSLYSYPVISTCWWRISLVTISKSFFYYLLFSSRTANFGPLWMGQPHTMFTTAFYLFRPEGHWEPRNEVGSQNLPECSKMQAESTYFCILMVMRKKKKRIRIYISTLEFNFTQPNRKIWGARLVSAIKYLTRTPSLLWHHH